MLSYIPSFYLLQRLTTDQWSRQDTARAAFEEMADSLSTCLRDYLFMACLGESRHSLGKTGSGFDGFSGKERDEVYAFAHKYAMSPENIQALVDIFSEDRWGKKPGYGGKKWQDLAVIVGQYDKLSRPLFVDAVVNAQHNGGTAFSKSEAHYHMDIDFNINFGTLQTFLNFRRESPDILNGFTSHFTGVSLTAGKLAIAHAVETHSKLEANKLHPIEDHVYHPVKWGKLDLPKIIKQRRSCYRCGKYVDDLKKCHECGYWICEKCFGDGEYCNSCSSHKIVHPGRCPVCLQEMSDGDYVTVSCGIYVHPSCVNYHKMQCSVCYKGEDDNYGGIYDHCVYCHMPIHNDMEHWTTYNDGKYVHQYCFHLVKGSPASDVKSSKQLFNEIAVLCPICKMPVLKDQAVFGPACDHYGSTQEYHAHCVMLHEIDCSTSVLCDCGVCTAEQGVWKQMKKKIALKESSHVKKAQK